MDFESEALRKRWSSMMAEFKKHFDVLEKDTGAPDHEVYWKGKQ